MLIIHWFQVEKELIHEYNKTQKLQEKDPADVILEDEDLLLEDNDMNFPKESDSDAENENKEEEIYQGVQVSKVCL